MNNARRPRMALGHMGTPNRVSLSRYAMLIATVLGSVALCAGCAGGGHATSSERPAARPAPGRFFAPGSVWNRPLPGDSPVARDSHALVSRLQKQVKTAGPWIATTNFSVPIARAGRHQRRVKVTLDTGYAPLQRAFASVPVPPGARPAPGGDRHLVVWQPSTNTMWEFWLMQRKRDGWHARWGARIRNVSRSPGINPSPTGATASGLPLVGGLMTLPELRRGRIDHALAVALPSTRAGVAAWPATRTDGQDPSPTAIPEGTRFRLDPKVDVGRLGLSRTGEAIARAAQRYGIIVRDKAGAVVFYGQEPPRTNPRAYHAVFRGAYPNQILARFPWDRLQVVRSRVRPVTHG
jgi:hypothetical protein